LKENSVITGLGPVIHVLLSLCADKDVDGRVKPGHDAVQTVASLKTEIPESIESVAANFDATGKRR